MTPGGGPGGLVIYYSPDAGCITDSTKFCSETELQQIGREVGAKQRMSCGTPDHSTGHSNAMNTHFVKRPMSFMKALEMTDKMDRNDHNNQLSPRQLQRPPNNEDNRQSQYEMNYEISV